MRDKRDIKKKKKKDIKMVFPPEELGENRRLTPPLSCFLQATVHFLYIMHAGWRRTWDRAEV